MSLAPFSTESIISQYNYKNFARPSIASQIDTFLAICSSNKADHALSLLLQEEDPALQEKWKELLEGLGWKFIQFNDRSTIIVESPDLPNWLLKCSKMWEKNIRRCPAANKLRSVVNELELNHLFRIPDKMIMPLFEKYVVLAEKMSLISANATISKLGKREDLDIIAEQLCALIAKSGLADVHFENICMTTDGLLTVIDTDSLGETNAALLGLRTLVDLTKSIKALKLISLKAQQSIQDLEAQTRL